MPQVLYITAPRTVELRDEPEGEIAPNEARVKMCHSGISHGTEMHFYSGVGSRAFPDTTGYSSVGEITEVGSQFTAARVGDAIFDYVGHCTGFVISQENPVYRLPPGLDRRNGIFAALASVAYNGVLESQVALGETVAVFGLGVVGQLTVALLKRAGAFTVIAIDPIANRRDAAITMGAAASVDPLAGDIEQQVRALNNGELVDVVIETSGAISGLNDAIKIIRPQSLIVPLSLYGPQAPGLDLSGGFHRKRVQLRVAQGDSTPIHLAPRWNADRRLRSAMSLLPELPLDVLITHHFRIEDASDAYEFVLAHARDCIQVVFEYGEEKTR